ncbi:hypothetical protein [Pedobacter antarcticus]|uniref:hypothetical protein n=1 Tax=Pedobacter antarcticus TaxID=34086 RepID=UPI00088CBA04|nr:hypothetical protein [Pedobacter antarcticus]SDM48819.1 hypothetical protein SAMN04488084_107112 [Pedobacter antarcticus]
MNTIEEQIWNYLDGNCTAAEEHAIQNLVRTQEDWKTAFVEIQSLNLELKQMELEEPSMSFTRNVMEKVKLEPAPISLKTRVDHRIIMIIGGFFVLMIVAVLIYAITLTKTETQISGIHLAFTAPDFSFLNKIQSPGLLRAFLFADLLLGLVYLDRFMRRKRKNNIHTS